MCFTAVVSTSFISVVSHSLVYQQKWSFEVKFKMSYCRKLTLKGSKDNSLFKFNFASVPVTHIYLFMLFDLLPFDVFN